jgi:hypothetical protein
MDAMSTLNLLLLAALVVLPAAIALAITEGRRVPALVIALLHGGDMHPGQSWVVMGTSRGRGRRRHE